PQRPQRLGRLVPAHRVLGEILQHPRQVRDRRAVARLAQAVRQLVLEQRRGGGEARRDGLDGGQRGRRAGRVLARDVLEREEGAEADRERGRLGCERRAEGCDGGEDRGGGVLGLGGDGCGWGGHFFGGFWVIFWLGFFLV